LRTINDGSSEQEKIESLIPLESVVRYILDFNANAYVGFVYVKATNSQVVSNRPQMTTPETVKPVGTNHSQEMNFR
jgi:hypothetical protein